MDDESKSNSIFSWPNPPTKEHLKPLSVYSRMVMCDQKDSPCLPKEPDNPFVNLKIQIMNDCGRKRKLLDDNMGDDYSSPCKKQSCSNVLSPDLGCFMDYSNSLTRNNSISPFAAPYPKLNEKTLRSEIKEAVSSRVDLEHVHCSCSKDEVGIEKILKNMSSVFDHDVDDIFCLNPLKQEVQKPTNEEEKLDSAVVEDDRGYVSSFHLHENEECKTEGPHEQQGHKQASVCGQHFSFLIKDGSETVGGPLLGPVKCDGHFLEEEDEVLNIGQPIFESSICQSAAAVEQKSGTSEALREPVHISQTYNSGDFTVDSLYETTLPLEVQVKSKVVVLNQVERISKPEWKASSADQNRLKIFDNSMEWERQKRQYIFSVRSHMNENRGGAQGLMTELLDLMTHVAGQAGSNGSQWQHPSDLTCRNYQKRFGNETPTMTLSEWQAQNQTHYRRFTKVPKIFKRSPFL
ncbi:uncharacterized protein LOC124855736 [Girardinichthys multiradiatus]|uniref:uncharacterized protein LOC124855736 n=1 Tax=Girardinichthys multiradiatus TaxID=208333 RepID=UPI001FADCA1B|nr:uncharacterized protein LOC124855736 [Girardinichthys multiradiatus]